MTTPTITAGILRAKEIKVTLAGQFTFNEKPVKAGQFIFGVDGHFVTSGGELYDEVRLVPQTPDSRFTLHDVTIGIDFHWQQREDQTFGGELQLLVFRDEVQAINCINVEDYLLSVISSEMNAEAPEEFLKAHAVISRSWALAQVEACFDDSDYFEPMVKEDETVMWYDHCAHTIFDVCADDHCQRYQGVTRATTPAAERAIEATRGEVLTFDGDLCDTRFSKCCGGISERFSTCWQPVDMPYLEALTDSARQRPADVSAEADAERWILGRPDAFCANPSERVLSMVLNNYDRSTPHLYRWTVSNSADELADIVNRRSGMDFGRILDLQPLHRGGSGRIDRLRIVGTRRTHVFGRELEIRRTLSETHLYSSAFVVIPGEKDGEGVPASWTLRGAGWGHGVGLCQIGAAVMATEGYDYRQILAHYFPGAELTSRY